MCGFVKNVTDSPAVQELMIQLGMGELVGKIRGGPSYNRQSLRDMIIATPSLLHVRDTVWWYALKPELGKYVPNWDVTSFNARNLGSPMWRNAIRERRGLIIVDTIGESNPIPGRKTPVKYLMESEEPMLIGTVYKEWDDGTFSAAIITRDPTPGFKAFHEKSMPLFLPPTEEFVSVWLDPNIKTSPLIEQVLNEPKLYNDLWITPVESYKSAKRKGETVLLKADE